MNSSAFNGVATFANGLLKRPANLVENQDGRVVTSSLSMMKSLHDILVADSTKFKIKNEHLVVANMNDDQIWEQLTIHLNALDKGFSKYINSLPEELAHEMEDETTQVKGKAQAKKGKKSQVESEDEGESDQDSGDQDNEIDLESEYEDDSEEEVEQVKNQKKPSKKATATTKESEEDEDAMEEEGDDDGEEGDDDEEDEEGDENDLFGKNEQGGDYEEKLDFAEMNAFLDKQDEEELKRDSDVEDELGSDYELDDGDSDMGEGEDGFKFKNDLVDDYEPSEEDDGAAADESGDEKLREADYDAEDEIFDLEREHALQEETVKQPEPLEKLKNEDEIDRLEGRLIGDKEWLLKGEINSKSRPINSLVERDIDFRKNIKVQQEIDEKYNKSLEALIKQRILDDAYDDRVRINFEQAFKETFANAAEINKEKSKLGLGDLYEQDFKNSLGLPSTNKEDKLKLEIHNLFKEVCYKLDALSNLSFTPKPVLQKPVITTNVPSLAHESRIPIAVSQADTQRPEEVFNKKKEVVHQSSVEMTHEEKQTERRQKKSAIRQRNKEKEAKKLIKNLEYNGQTKHEYTQIKKAQANGKKMLEGKRQKSVEFTRSSEFFKNMQNSQQSDAAGGNKKNFAEKKTKPISKQYK